MKLTLLALAFGVVASGAAIADSYQGEVGVRATRVNSDYFDSDGQMYGLSGAYYFTPVNTGGVPLAEAAYLGQNSNFFGDYLYAPSQHSVPRAEIYTLGAEVYIPENFLYVKAGASHLDTKAPYADDNDWFVSVGLTPLKGLLVTTSYSENAGYNPNVRAKYVTNVGAGRAINVEVGVTDVDNAGTATLIGGDFYFDETLSLGGEVRELDSSRFNELRVRKFFTPDFSGAIKLANTPHENAVRLDVGLRF